MPLKICPFSVGLFVYSVVSWTVMINKQQKQKQLGSGDKAEAAAGLPPVGCGHIVFVLGGPGTGKGTQCQLIVERNNNNSTNMKWVHLSAGDLLRAERNKTSGDTKLKTIINDCISNGQLVPSEVTCQLILNAIQNSVESNETTHFLIDGFPRSFGNVTAWETTAGRACVSCVLNFECPETVLVSRLLERGKASGRVDDQSTEIIHKRFQTHLQETAPVIEAYQTQGIQLHTIPVDQPIEEVYQQVHSILLSLSSS